MDAIIAIGENGAIGLNGELPWRCKADLKHFKALTMGKKLVVGRKTFEKLPPLKGRSIHVLSRGIRSIEAQINLIKPDFIVGGKSIYEQTLHLCDVIHVSIINDYTEGDVFYSIPKELEYKCKYYYFNKD